MVFALYEKDKELILCISTRPGLQILLRILISRRITWFNGVGSYYKHIFPYHKLSGTNHILVTLQMLNFDVSANLCYVHGTFGLFCPRV